MLLEMEELLVVFDCLDEEDFDLDFDRPATRRRNFTLWDDSELLKHFRLHKDTATEVMK